MLRQTLSAQSYYNLALSFGPVFIVALAYAGLSKCHMQKETGFENQLLQNMASMLISGWCASIYEQFLSLW